MENRAKGFFSVRRDHEIAMGHRVFGHESKCANLHGHNYTFGLECSASRLDEIGRVIDFGVIKSTLCEWLESAWDHKMVLWKNDPLLYSLRDLGVDVVEVPLNPTAENLARMMVETIAPSVLEGTGVRLHRCVVRETGKCEATYDMRGYLR